MAVDLKGEDECGIIRSRRMSNDFIVFDSSSSTRRLNLTTREGRLQTFIDWPPSHPIQPLDLAEAGFYYTGKSYYKYFIIQLNFRASFSMFATLCLALVSKIAP